MTKDEALKMAIEAFELEESTWWSHTKMAKAYQACKEALEQPTMTYEQGFDHGYEAHRVEQENDKQESIVSLWDALTDEQPAQKTWRHDCMVMGYGWTTWENGCRHCGQSAPSWFNKHQKEKPKTTYEQPHGWMQQLVSETDGKKTIRYTFTKTRIGKNDIPIYFQEALEQPENDTKELKLYYDNLTIESIKKELKEEPKCSNHPDAPHGFCRDASHSAGRYVCECEGWETEQPAQEPYKFIHPYYGNLTEMLPTKKEPIAPSWQGLSDDELDGIVDKLNVSLILDCSISDFVGAIEAKLKEKNHG